MSEIRYINTSFGAALVKLVLLSAWVVGIVLANGFWSTLFSIFIPPWALYLTAEKVLTVVGWLS